MSENGDKGFFGKVAAAIKRRLPRTRKFLFFTGPPDITYEGTLAAKGFNMVELTLENIDEALSWRKPEVVQQLRSYLERGFAGWYAALGDEVAGYAFMAVAGTEPVKVRHIYLHPGEAGSMMVYTRPEYRIFGVGPALTKEISAKAAAMDSVNTFVVWGAPVHERWNESLKAYRMMPAGRLWILEFCGRPIIRYTSGSPVKR